jgi:lipopolysaccharide export system permease protein
MEMLRFEQSPFDLAPFTTDQRAVILKEPDRYLPELFYPDMTNFYDNDNADRLLAEGHARLAAPLLNFAMALLAIYAVLGGDFSRRGYARRIAIASGVAVSLRLLAFGAVSASEDDPGMNYIQYVMPLAVIAGISLAFFFLPGRLRKKQARQKPPGGPARRAGGGISFGMAGAR